MVKKVVLFTGPDHSFQELLDQRIDEGESSVDFLHVIRHYNYRVRANDFTTQDFEMEKKPTADSCIVRAVDFGSVLEHVISNFSSVITQSFNFSNLYVQNPPARVRASLANAFPDAIECIEAEYPQITAQVIASVHRSLSKEILGQVGSKREIALSLYRLSVMKDSRPVVLMFYGPSGVGKTETAKCLSESMGGGLTRVQISMMQTSEAYEYIFGAEHSKGSFARDLLARESNVILLDEFDKVNRSLYNAFYQLFDEGEYVDTNYRVAIHDGVFILTSNFSSEAEIRRELGSAMFSRLGACIPFDELSVEAKRAIAKRHYSVIYNRLSENDKAAIDLTDIEKWFEHNADRYDNMRIMKTKIDRAIFGHLTDLFINDACSVDGDC